MTLDAIVATIRLVALGEFWLVIALGLACVGAIILRATVHAMRLYGKNESRTGHTDEWRAKAAPPRARSSRLDN